MPAWLKPCFLRHENACHPENVMWMIIFMAFYRMPAFAIATLASLVLVLYHYMPTPVPCCLIYSQKDLDLESLKFSTGEAIYLFICWHWFDQAKHSKHQLRLSTHGCCLTGNLLWPIDKYLAQPQPYTASVKVRNCVLGPHANQTARGIYYFQKMIFFIKADIQSWVFYNNTPLRSQNQQLPDWLSIQNRQ